MKEGDNNTEVRSQSQSNKFSLRSQSNSSLEKGRRKTQRESQVNYFLIYVVSVIYSYNNSNSIKSTRPEQQQLNVFLSFFQERMDEENDKSLAMAYSLE